LHGCFIIKVISCSEAPQKPKSLGHFLFRFAISDFPKIAEPNERRLSATSEVLHSPNDLKQLSLQNSSHKSSYLPVTLEEICSTQNLVFSRNIKQQLVNFFWCNLVFSDKHVRSNPSVVMLA